MSTLPRRALLGLLPGLALAQNEDPQRELLRLLERFNTEPGDASFAALEREYKRMQAAGLAGDQERRWVSFALMSLGRYDEAEVLARELPAWRERRWPRRVELEPGAPVASRYWEVDLQTWQLYERRLASSVPPQLWVQSSVGCGFSQRSAADLGSDAELGPLLRAHSHWFADGDDLFNTRAWADKHPGFALKLVTRAEGWSFRRPWSTPSFQFVREGRVIHQFSGWPKDGSHRPQLVDGLKQVGLL